MKYAVAFAGIALIGFAGIAVAGESEAEVRRVPLGWEQAALSDGADLYVTLCAVCHGQDGTGGGPAVEALSIAVPDLTMMAASKKGSFPAVWAERVIKGDLPMAAHGSSEMPIWGTAFLDVRPDWKMSRREAFAELRIQALVKYLESIQVDAGMEMKPADR